MEAENGVQNRVDFSKGRAARELFQGKMTALESQIEYTGHYDELLVKGLEGGLARAHSYRDPQTQEVLTAAPVAMLNRNGFMYIVNDYVRDHSVKEVKFTMLDIGAVKQMDQHLAADYNHNRIAQTIQTVCTKYADLPVLECRYGGDEFAVAVFGTLTPDQEQRYAQLQDELQTHIATLSWNRKTEEDIQAVHITSTRQSSEVFDSQVGTTLYQLYLQRGVILPNEEISKMVREMMILNLQHGIDFPEQFARIAQKKHEYPPDITTVSGKLEYHAQNHPEYKTAIDQALRNDEIDGKTLHSAFVCDFIERVVYDQLLGDNIVTFADFQDHDKENAFAEVVAVEGKFLKEANKLNYLQGDNVKLGLWESIKDVIEPQSLKSLTIGNRAGSFLLGIKKGVPADTISDIKAALRSLSQATVVIRGNSIEVPLGVAFESDHPQVSSLNKVDRLHALRKISDENWYRQLVHDLGQKQFNHDELVTLVHRSTYKSAPDLGESTKETLLPIVDKQLYTYNHLLTQFFQEPKRATERLQEMQRYVKPNQVAIFQMPEKRKKNAA